MRAVFIIGCGFVADLYMRSFALYPDIKIAAVYDLDAKRCQAFCRHWHVPPTASLEALFSQAKPGDLVLNLTNPSAHFDINFACLKQGLHVYSEKPLALDMKAARTLHALAEGASLLLASAPCSLLGEAAQTLGFAIKNGTIGVPRLIYAELDDGFIPQAPYQDWISDSGAPWPFKDEFRTGCTLEHAGYYLSWMIGIFGPITSVIAASAELLPDKVATGAPDFSVAVLSFENGLVARLTCSILAPHDHRLRVIGDLGVLQVKQAWNNAAAVRFHRRLNIRRRLLENPFGRRIRLSGPTHAKVSRKGAAAMNFALGPIEMLEALDTGRPCRLSNDFALHLNEVTLAIQNAGLTTGPQKMRTTCTKPEPMSWAR